MKKKHQKTPLQWVAGTAFTLLTVFVMTACQKEIKPTPTAQSEAETKLKQKTVASTASRLICYPVYYFEIGRRSWNCLGWQSFCRTVRWKCIPIYYEEWPPRKWWDIYDIWKLRDELINYEKIPDLGREVINPEKQFGVLPVNSHVVVIQFYENKDNMLTEEKLTIEEKFELDRQLAEDFQLKGFTVAPGTYPVVYDKETKTFNAIVNVQ